MKVFALLPILAMLYLYHGANAASDASTPCLNGSCSFNVTRTNSSMAAALTINGPVSSISDITPAAGWEVLNCTSSTNTQTIQLVCTDISKGCDHLFQQGAENTIVRLPQGCGAGPFARVAQHSLLANHTKRDNSSSNSTQVHLLQIDTNFKAAASSGQTVSFNIVASTDPDFSIPNPTKFDKSTSSSQSVSFDKSANLFSDTLSCAGDDNANEDVTLSVDVDADVDLNVAFTFEIAGTVIPPDVSTFEVSATVDGTVDGTLNVDADLTGTLSTGEVALFTVGLPGLSIPDILTIGPMFVLNGEATATLNLDADLSIGVSYELNGLGFSFGSSSSSSSGFSPLDSPVTFSLQPTISAEATLEAHIIPTLSFGISAFSNSASIFVDLDAGLEVDLNATVSGDVGSSSGGSASESAEACVDISSPIAFNVGAEGDFFGLIDASKSLAIFERTFDIFQKCITQSASTALVRGSTPAARSVAASRRDGFVVATARSANANLLAIDGTEAWTEKRASSNSNSISHLGKRSPKLVTRDFACPPAADPDFAPISTSSDSTPEK